MFFWFFFSFFSLEQHLTAKKIGREMGYGRGGYHIYVYVYTVYTDVRHMGL